MQLFLFLNDLAGRWPWVDELFRIVYMATLPVLGTLLLARLTLFPKAPHDPPRSRVVLATILAVALCILTMLAINGLASLLHLGVLSPRPFMTRRINLLIVEPQDNSFPAPEMMVATVFALVLAGLGRRWAITAGISLFWLAFARLYCGSNYLIDIVVGSLIGAGWAGLSLSLVHAPIRRFTRTLQLSWSSALLGCTLLGIYIGLTLQPRFATKLYAPWSAQAKAAPATGTATGKNESPIKSARDARGALQEGEGVTESEDAEHEAEVLALSKRSALFLPEVESFLKGRLSPRTKPFSLLDVEVAPVRAGNTSYRCAAVRFEIRRDVPHLRRQVAECAARLVKLSFALDSRMQNVDVIAILRGDGKAIDGSDVTFIGDEVPVFTASVQRKNLVLKSPAWANSASIDGGSWLRFRSRLFVNEKVLPDDTLPPGEPLPQPQGQLARPKPKPTTTPRPTATPLPPATQLPTATPSPTATPRPTVTPQPSPFPTATQQPNATATKAPGQPGGPLVPLPIVPNGNPNGNLSPSPTSRPAVGAHQPNPSPTPRASRATVAPRARPARKIVRPARRQRVVKPRTRKATVRKTARARRYRRRSR